MQTEKDILKNQILTDIEQYETDQKYDMGAAIDVERIFEKFKRYLELK